jgi:hypothetical protein
MTEIYLPIVVTSGQPVLGVQVDANIAGNEQYVIENRMYQTPARWSGLDSWLLYNISMFGDNPFILGTKTCPPGYRLWEDFLGSPPKEECYIYFADFATELAEVYQPWGIELWNEPDVPRRFSVPNYYGSWVDNDDKFYNYGKSYGKFCGEVYETIHNAGTKVIAGALLGSESSLEFLSGAVDDGFRADYVSYHTYLYMTDEFDKPFRFAEKLRKLTTLPLILSETSIIGDGSLEHQQRQADYLTYLRKHQYWGGIDLILWYSLFNNWNHTALVQNKLPTLAMEVWRTNE